MDRNVDPVRRIAFPFTGDPWAQPGAQVEVPPPTAFDPDPRTILTCDGRPLRFRVVAYDGTGSDAAPVDGDASTFDATVVKIRADQRGNTTLSRTATTFDTEGEQAIVGEDQTEPDVSASDRVIISLVSAAQDGAAALWIFVDSGAK